MNNCDPNEGVCVPSSILELEKIDGSGFTTKTEIIYVGDPMCSWCWGISPELKKLQEALPRNRVSFKILVGGLRPGGGDRWDAQMKFFLRDHWEHVSEMSGQVFNYNLLELDHFNYDTEPSCRAMVAARPFLTVTELSFFTKCRKSSMFKMEIPTKSPFIKKFVKLRESITRLF
ncbi:MAG: hypothetical protein AAF789_03035 [Bacteroidota bacterium]